MSWWWCRCGLLESWSRVGNQRMLSALDMKHNSHWDVKQLERRNHGSWFYTDHEIGSQTVTMAWTATKWRVLLYKKSTHCLFGGLLWIDACTFQIFRSWSRIRRSSSNGCTSRLSCEHERRQLIRGYTNKLWFVLWSLWRIPSKYNVILMSSGSAWI